MEKYIINKHSYHFIGYNEPFISRVPERYKPIIMNEHEYKNSLNIRKAS